MAPFFWLLTVIIGVIAINGIRKQRYFNILTYCFVGTFIPILIYFLKLTRHFVEPISEGFYITFISLAAVLLLVPLVDEITGNNRVYSKMHISYKSRIDFTVYNIFYLVMFFAENYLLSGYFMPALHGIDAHTDRISILVYFTNTSYVVLMGNLLSYIATRKKRYIIWAIGFLIFPVLGKGSRIEVAFGLVQVAIFILYYWWRNKGRFIHTGKEKRKERRKKVLLIIGGILLVISMINYGIYRSNSVIKYITPYSTGIGYKGPFGEIGAWIYGYSVYPFNNLNNNILNGTIDYNFLGFSAFKAFWFGIMHVASYTNLYSDMAVKNALVITSTCNVNTGYWDFYYDFGNFIIIPFLICLLIYAILSIQKNRARANIGNHILFFYWSTLWLFMFFNNVVGFDMVLINMVIMYVVFNLMFRIEYERDVY